MSRINLPINQVRLTNVAVVRMNRGGKRFEIACYRNKVVDYRQGLEQDLSEVLQTERIFANVSKGEFSKGKDLQTVFGTKDEEKIAKLILRKGQVQVSDKERSQQLEKTTAQVAEWISNNCVHPASDRPYTISQIRHAMANSGFTVHPTKPLKRQNLDCVKLLQSTIPIQRAKMELLLIIPTEHEEVEQVLKDNNVKWTDPIRSSDKEEDASKQIRQYKILVDPRFYRVLNEVVQRINGGRIEIITQIVTKQGDVKLETELDGNATHSNFQIVNKQMGDLSLIDQSKKPSIANSNDSSDDEVAPSASQRKQQKKARKKNRKAKRRGEGADMDKLHNDVPSISSSLQSQDFVSTSVATTMSSLPTGGGGAADTRKSCNTCGGFFETAAVYRVHFRSDWHRFNQKLKMKGAASISEQEFLACDSETFFGSEDGLLMM